MFVTVGRDEKNRLFWSSSVHPEPAGVYLLWQESQYIGDGPFLVGAVLNGQMESGLGLFACH